jgi:hypothetical protein
MTPKFKIQVRRTNNGQMEFDSIRSVLIPSLTFSNQAYADSWQQAVANFQRSFARVQDSDIVSFGGSRGYGWDYKFFLVNSLMQYAARLGTPVEVEKINQGKQQPPKQAQQPATGTNPVLEQAVKDAERASKDTAQLLGG